MLTYKKGDLMEFTEDAFGHGCNCFKAMGSGVALAVKRVYPELYKADQFDERESEGRLGMFTFSELSNKKMGYNIYSQFKYGVCRPGNVKVQYDKLKSALVLVCEDMKNRNLLSLALPKIGCGLAGGSWDIVEKILIEVSNSEGINITVYEL